MPDTFTFEDATAETPKTFSFEEAGVSPSLKPVLPGQLPEGEPALPTFGEAASARLQPDWKKIGEESARLEEEAQQPNVRIPREIFFRPWTYLPRTQETERFAERVSSGLESMTSLEGAASLPWFLTPLGPFLESGVGVQQLISAGKEAVAGNYPEALADVALGIVPAIHGPLKIPKTVRRLTAPVSPPPLPIVPPSIPKEVIPDASSIQKAAEVHGDVRTQPFEGEGKVPVEEGGKGVLPPAKAKPEVPLEQDIFSDLSPNWELEEKYPDQFGAEISQRLIKNGQIPIEYKDTQGNVHPGLLSGYWEGLPGTPPNVGRWMNGGWSHGPFQNPAEKIISKIPPPPEPKVATPPPLPSVARPGPGAASPSEFAPEAEQKIRTAFAQMNERRVARGVPPIEPTRGTGDEAVWRHAIDLVDDDPTVQDRLISEINESGKPSAEHDLDVQDALLRHRYVNLENDLERTKNRLFEAQESGDPSAIRDAQESFDSVLKELDELDKANKTIGTGIGRGLRARQLWANEDFSLIKMVGDKRAAKGAKLTVAEAEKVAEVQKDIETKQTAANDAVARDRAVDVREAGDDAVKSAGDEAAKQAETDKASGTVRDLDAEKEQIKDYLKDKFTETGSLEGVNRAIRKLMEILWEQGVRTREDMEWAIHKILNDILPPDHGMTLEEVQDLMSGYGQYKLLPKTPTKIGVRDIVGQIQQVRKLLDFFKGQAPSKTGIERRIPSDKERALIKVVNEAKSAFGTIPKNPEQALRSALDAVNTRLKHRIADLKQEISTRAKIVREKTPTPYNDETLRLRKELEDLKAKHAEIFGEPELTPEQRLQRAIASIDRQIEEVQRQLKSGEVFPSEKPSKVPPSDILNAKRAELEALKEQREWIRDTLQPKLEPEARQLLGILARWRAREADYRARLAAGDFESKTRRVAPESPDTVAAKARFEEAKLDWRRGLELDRLSKRTPFQRTLDFISKWKRSAVLLWPTSIAKLTAAAAEGIGVGTMEEVVGSATRYLVPKAIRDKALRYGGGLSISREVKALSSTVQNLLKDAAAAAKGKGTELDLLYGKPEVAPQGLADWIGNLHYALKTPLMRNEFTRSFEILGETYKRRGYDITDPAVVQRIGNQAYLFAEERLFLEDNIAVGMYRNALNYLERNAKGTKAPKFVGQVAATLLRYEIPIVKIPTNLVKRAFEYSFGQPLGGVRIARAFIRGIDSLPEAEADAILRNLRRGTLGTAFLLYGYFHHEDFGGYYQEGEKRRPGALPYGGAKFGDVEIPRVVLHHPLLEQLQIGATMWNVQQKFMRKGKSQLEGLGAGLMAAMWGLTEEAPFAREMTDTLKAIGNSIRTGTPAPIIGEQLRSAIPGVIQWLARQLDSDINGDTTRRDPKTVWEHVELGLPGLREDVPLKR